MPPPMEIMLPRWFEIQLDAKHIAEGGYVVNTSSRGGCSFVKNWIRIRQERVGSFYQKLCWPNVLEFLLALLPIISGVSSMVTGCLALGKTNRPNWACMVSCLAAWIHYDTFSFQHCVSCCRHTSGKSDHATNDRFGCSYGILR